MAVPKKRTSKAKSKSRKATWKRKAKYASERAISLGKSIIAGNNQSFVYINNDARDNQDT
uniref:Large ribosomal subunit protein bL32c n=1 Tax=Hommersandiophycus borowitzkae TaxID=268573 RepID=A0A1G4NTU5_9FLOR|nr:Ribosomal protein L32 [Hommersandiophycus borowitzkae]SCW22078.1 Ribosomal protein L32 [Hommersandiophycus borowitzkae]